MSIENACLYGLLRIRGQDGSERVESTRDFVHIHRGMSSVCVCVCVCVYMRMYVHIATEGARTHAYARVYAHQSARIFESMIGCHPPGSTKGAFLIEIMVSLKSTRISATCPIFRQ